MSEFDKTLVREYKEGSEEDRVCVQSIFEEEVHFLEEDIEAHPEDTSLVEELNVLYDILQSIKDGSILNGS